MEVLYQLSYPGAGIHFSGAEEVANRAVLAEKLDVAKTSRK